jgi:hypothetical protein
MNRLGSNDASWSMRSALRLILKTSPFPSASRLLVLVRFPAPSYPASGSRSAPPCRRRRQSRRPRGLRTRSRSSKLPLSLRFTPSSRQSSPVSSRSSSRSSSAWSHLTTTPADSARRERCLCDSQREPPAALASCRGRFRAIPALCTLEGNNLALRVPSSGFGIRYMGTTLGCRGAAEGVFDSALSGTT